MLRPTLPVAVCWAGVYPAPPRAGEAPGSHRLHVQKQSVISNRCLMYLLLINPPEKPDWKVPQRKQAETAAW